MRKTWLGRVMVEYRDELKDGILGRRFDVEYLLKANANAILFLLKDRDDVMNWSG